MKVEILGTACEMCDHLEENLKKALGELGVEVKIEHIRDVEQLLEHGVKETPALAIDGVVKIAGRIPLVTEIKEWIREGLNTP